MSDAIEVCVGRVGRAHGIRGEVSVEVLSDEPDRRFADGRVLTARRPRAADRPLTVASRRWHQGRLLVRFAEASDRTAAEEARGLLLYVDLDPAEQPDDDEEFYDHQLVGLGVVDEQGRPLGTLVDVRHPGAQDLLVVSTTDGREALVPFVTALVPTVDLAGGRVVVADRPGLVAPAPDEPEEDR